MAGKHEISEDVKAILDSEVGDLQREERILRELETGEHWKYFLALLAKDRLDVKNVARQAPTDFLYLRASLANEALETVPEILSRRKAELNVLILQKKQQFEQYL